MMCGPPRAKCARDSGGFGRGRERQRRWLGGRSLFGICALGFGVAHADTLQVARVGAFEIDAKEIQQRAARLAPFQLLSLGATWPEQRRRLLSEVLVPEALLAAASARDDALPFSASDSALRQALLLDIRKGFARAAPEQIQSFYEQHRSRYETPASILIWRIRVATETDARALLAQLDPPKENTWSLLAREHSTDDATNMRAGSLGYVAADGQTNMPELRVAPALYAAAAGLKDGELLPRPIPDADGFALIWRRGSRPASVRSLREVSAEIGGALLDQAVANGTRALLEQLRQRDLHDYAPTLLSGFEPQAPEVLTAPANPAPSLGPAAASNSQRPVQLVPRETDLGLR